MKILLADDHALIRSGLRCELAELAGSIEFVEAWDVESLRRVFEQHRDLDLALVDLTMPGMDGARTIGALRAQFPAVPLVVVSGVDDGRQVQDVLRAGAVGFIPKSAVGQLVLPAIRLVLAGGQYLPPQLMATFDVQDPPPLAADGSPMPTPPQPSRIEALSPRQEEVFALMAKGLSNKMIARQLNISEGTVKSHVATIFDVLRVHNRVSAIAAARVLSGDAERRHGLGD
ncbi:MAG TPA: response regulator transcription factor [Rudaea sp.]|jgi:DNA-binding NarL/FixJ family response regulator